jgi:tRNA(adenine34) deaminase
MEPERDREFLARLGGHEAFMRRALAEAERAADEGDIPVGAVLVQQGRIIGKARNQRELLRDPTAHAEILALTQGAEALQNWRLTGTVLYVTLEPCAMCAGALVLARVRTVVYGAPDPRAGACGSVFDVVREPRLNHQLEVIPGVLEDECGGLLEAFFRGLRGPSAPPPGNASSHP